MVSLPHSADDTSEATKKHRRRQVDRLIRQVLASSRSLACAQEGEHSVREVHGH
jgi:hypothetical protein